MFRRDPLFLPASKQFRRLLAKASRSETERPSAISIDVAVSLRLVEDAMRLGPVPKCLELWRRSLPGRKVLPMLHQHLRERHSVSSGTVRIGAALEQGQGIRIGEVVVESHFCAVKQQRITGRIRLTIGHRGIDVRPAIQTDPCTAFAMAKEFPWPLV